MIPKVVTDHPAATNHVGVCLVCGRRQFDDKGNPTHAPRPDDGSR